MGTMAIVRPDRRETQEFFSLGLAIQALPYKPDEAVKQHVANVLANFAVNAQSNTLSRNSVKPAHPEMLLELSEFPERFPFPNGELRKSDILEIATDHLILWGGFFRLHLEPEDARLYDKLGSAIFMRAGKHAKNARKVQVFRSLATTFPEWARLCSGLHQSLCNKDQGSVH